MRKLLLSGTAGLLLNLLGTPAAAQVSVHIGIPLPPPIVFSAPPDVVVLPETEVYVVPDASEDIFFSAGWWWRPWGGRWYRSRSYDRGWSHYGGVPSFYRGVPRGWRDDYRGHRWGGGPWNHESIHPDDLQRNWRGWHETRHWEQPEHRQYQLRRDGRPFEARGNPGRRPEPGRREGVNRGPAENRREDNRHEVNRDRAPRENRDRGRDDRGARDRGRPEPGRGDMNKDRGPGRDNRGPNKEERRPGRP